MKMLLALSLLLVICSLQAATNVPSNLIVVAHDIQTSASKSTESSLPAGYASNLMHNDAVKKVVEGIKSRQSGQHIGTRLLTHFN